MRAVLGFGGFGGVRWGVGRNDIVELARMFDATQHVAACNDIVEPARMFDAT